jgi:hypothetical protein
MLPNRIILPTDTEAYNPIKLIKKEQCANVFQVIIAFS